MTQLRFILISVSVFAAAFGGMTLVARDYPLRGTQARAAKPGPAKREAVAPDATRKPAIEEAANPQPRRTEPRKPPEIAVAIPGDANTGRNRMRTTAIQAAVTFAQSPCDPMNKAAFIVAASTYMNAASGNTVQFGTPHDARVREAIQAAFETGGVSKNEFPAGAQPGLSAVAAQGDPPSPCNGGRRADNLQR